MSRHRIQLCLVVLLSSIIAITSSVSARQTPAVKTIEITPATAQAEAVVRRLLDADPSLSELEVQRAGLAEAFQEITRDTEEVREAA